ncbi:MAG: hypothetical protein WD467_03030 [Candidatus Saccharimonadales bacterium]
MFSSQNSGIDIDVPKLQRRLKTKPEAYWMRRGERMALELFQAMAKRVPAYKDFLAKNNIDPRKVKQAADLSEVTPVDKDNYLRQYDRALLCWDGRFKEENWVISSTSGSTGQPFYFPRQYAQDKQYADMAELYLRENFKLQDKSTLYIVAFPMGAWIGGVFTYQALQIVASRGYELSIITPGVHKGEIINAIKNLADDFDQIIIGSYGPFLKDILDDGVRAGIDWKRYNLGFILSAEVISETFRDYIAKKTGIDILTGSLNHYGTVDLGTMAHETPISILMRRRAVENSTLYNDIFGDITKLPTLAQYLPELFYFETAGGNLYCSANSGIPLVRYDLKDHGGLLTLTEIDDLSRRYDLGVEQVLQTSGAADSIWNLPFVYVYERSDFSVSFFGFQIYPETIRRALQSEVFESDITGKFTMEVAYSEEGRQQLTIHIELMAERSPSTALRRALEQVLVRQLLEESSEYRETHKHYKSDVRPHVKLWNYEHDTYFKSGTKQQWIKREPKP